MSRNPHINPDLYDPVALASDLIRCPSVTPVDAGALDVVEAALTALGFVCRRYRFGSVENLHARRGKQNPNLCFAGHTDVVPPGPRADWSEDPFAATIRDGVLIGRGAVDMKGAIAAYIAALAGYLKAEPQPPGSLSLLVTGDEEGASVDGMRRLLPAVVEAGENLSHCLVGEPTSADRLGDQIKNGRRGSLNCVVRARGKQGHAAYPHNCANPIPVLVGFLSRIAGTLDSGIQSFAPSNLEITSLDAVNMAHNVIPGEAGARFNIRFNPLHTGETLTRWLTETAKAHSEDGVSIALDIEVSGEAFLTEPDSFTAVLADAVEAETGATPDFSTGGGTSDARFIRAYCPVAECGLKNATAHRADEQVAVDELRALSRIYRRIIDAYFAAFSTSG